MNIILASITLVSLTILNLSCSINDNVMGTRKNNTKNGVIYFNDFTRVDDYGYMLGWSAVISYDNTTFQERPGADHSAVHDFVNGTLTITSDSTPGLFSTILATNEVPALPNMNYRVTLDLKRTGTTTIYTRFHRGGRDTNVHHEIIELDTPLNAKAKFIYDVQAPVGTSYVDITFAIEEEAETLTVYSIEIDQLSN